LGLQTPLKSPECDYAFQFSVTAERLRAQVSLLQHENTELKELNAQRREHKKGARIALKDRLLLTADELRETARQLQEEENEKQKQKAAKAAKPRKPHKRKAQEMEAPTEEEVNSSDNDIES
jgi:hypothetical protein